MKYFSNFILTKKRLYYYTSALLKTKHIQAKIQHNQYSIFTTILHCGVLRYIRTYIGVGLGSLFKT